MNANHDCGCESARARLDPLIDRELNEQECADVRAHCENCTDCQEELALLERLTDRFREACATPPPLDVKMSIRNSLLSEPRDNAHGF